jgi:hypothetical protein
VDEDDVLMARLRDLLAATDGPPPAEFVAMAKQMFGLRSVDAELAALVADSAADSTLTSRRAVRGGAEARLLTFESAGLAVEIEVSGAGRSRRVLGQLVPPGPGTVEARQPALPAPRAAEVDERGRFTLDDLRPGPLSLTCRRDGAAAVSTSWVDIA